VIDASPEEESDCDGAANEAAGMNARDRAATSPTPTLRERFIGDGFPFYVNVKTRENALPS
jgi:hypothetical protein